MAAATEPVYCQPAAAAGPAAASAPCCCQAPWQRCQPTGYAPVLEVLPPCASPGIAHGMSYKTFGPGSSQSPVALRAMLQHEMGFEAANMLIIASVCDGMWIDITVLITSWQTGLHRTIIKSRFQGFASWLRCTRSLYSCTATLQAVRVASDSMSKQGSFEAVLREADSAEALLKRRSQVGASPLLDVTLVSQPKVFTLAIVWESARVSKQLCCM